MRTRRNPAAASAALAAVAAALAPALAACVDRTVGPRETPAALALTFDGGAAAAVPNGSVAVDLFYRRGDAARGEQVSLFSLRLRSDSLGGLVPASFAATCARQVLAGQPANCSVSVPLRIDLRACLADAQRAPAGPGCPIVATLVLRDANQRVLAQATVGPVQAIPGRPITLPEVVLPLRTP
jgi:hypothetical protein